VLRPLREGSRCAGAQPEPRCGARRVGPESGTRSRCSTTPHRPHPRGESRPRSRGGAAVRPASGQLRDLARFRSCDCGVAPVSWSACCSPTGSTPPPDAGWPPVGRCTPDGPRGTGGPGLECRVARFSGIAATVRFDLQPRLAWPDWELVLTRAHRRRLEFERHPDRSVRLGADRVPGAEGAAARRG